MRKPSPEDIIQNAIVEYIRLVDPDGVCAAVPNGGYRTKAEAELLKWTGVLAGFPDVTGIFGCNGKSYYLEVKTETGTLRKAQKDVHAKLKRLKVYHGVVHTVDEVRELFNSWGVKTREANV